MQDAYVDYLSQEEKDEHRKSLNDSINDWKSTAETLSSHIKYLESITLSNIERFVVLDVVRKEIKNIDLGDGVRVGVLKDIEKKLTGEK